MGEQPYLGLCASATLQKMNAEAERLIRTLGLQPHPEGGFYREMFRSEINVAASNAPRSALTSIYYLLSRDDFSAFHRLTSDEIWHYYGGSAIAIETIDGDGEHREIILGTGDRWQAAMPAGVWFGASVCDPQGYALIGCDVAPGFDFADFEMGVRDRLIAEFPQHRAAIERLTRL
jgi:uncharacterized protein